MRASGPEHVGPCPSCGGKDCFSFNTQKSVWNCRRHGGGGRDGIGLAQHLTGLDFLDACELLSGRGRPGRDGSDDAERREEAKRRLAEQRERAKREDAQREAEQNRYRAREWDRCRALWREAAPFDCDGASAKAYLAARGLDVSRLGGGYLRTHPRLGFFAEDAKGAKIAIHHGPAQLGLFCRLLPDAGSSSGFRWQSIGLHATWIDLAAAPKFRPAFVSPVDGEPLPSKKMRGSKAGGLIPVFGLLSSATRQVVGEGIETVLGFARFDGFRADTFYCAAGDLGNLAGKARSGGDEPGMRCARSGIGSRAGCWRFGQTRPVECHVAMADTERAIWDVVMRKSGDHEAMKREMTAAMARAHEHRTVKIDYRPTQPLALPAWLQGAS